MAKSYFTVVTDEGTRKMFEAVNAKKKINIAKFAVGDGAGKYYTPTAEMTTLKNEVWSGAANACYISEQSKNLLIVDSVIPAGIGGFTIREMGLFDDEGTLVAICNTPDTQKVKVADGIIHELELSMELALANTDCVEPIVDPTVIIATKKDIGRLRLEVQAQIEAINATTQEHILEALNIARNFEKNMDRIERDILNMKIVIATLADTGIMDSENSVIETFSGNNGVIMVSGIFDSAKACVYA